MYLSLTTAFFNSNEEFSGVFGIDIDINKFTDAVFDKNYFVIDDPD